MAITSLFETIQSCLEPGEVKLVVVGPYRQEDRQAVEAYLQDYAAGFS